MPAPGVLLAQYSAKNGGKHVSYEQEDLIKFGRQYEGGFPRRNVAQVGDTAEFHPSWCEATGMTPNTLSYCTYPFTIAGYDLTPQVRYGWSDVPADLQTVWLGVANWSEDRWDWYRAEADGLLSLPTFDPYISVPGDYFFIIVLHASVDVSALHYIGLGPNQVTAAIRAAPKYSLPPVHATAGSAASTTAVGTITKHEFDWNDDGIYEDDAGPVGASTFDVDALGTYSVGVRVTNSYGEQDAAKDTYTVIGPWQHSWGLEELDKLYAVVTDGSEYCYAAGSLTSSANGLQVVLLKYSLAGAWQWARAWGGVEDDCALGVACYQDKVFIAGYTENYGADGKDVLVQCWSTGGEVEWTRTWGGAEDDAGTGIALTANAVYVCGIEHVVSADDSGALLLKYGHDGTWDWARAWNDIRHDGAEDVVSYYDIMGGAFRLYATGYSEGSSYVPRVLYLSFKEDGTLAAQRAWERGGASARGYALAATGYPPQFYIAGDTGINGDALLLEVGAGSDSMAVTWGEIRSDTAYDLCIKDDHVLLCGATDWFEGNYRGFIVDLSFSGGYNGSSVWESELSAGFLAMAPFPGTGVLAAGFCTSADSSEWRSSSISLFAKDGTWSTLSGSLQSPTAIQASPSAAGIPVTYGVRDSGAGEDELDDAAIVSRGLP